MDTLYITGTVDSRPFRADMIEGYPVTASTTAQGWPIIRQLLRFIRPYRLWVLLGTSAALVNALITVAGGYFIKQITDATINRQPELILQTVYLIVAAAVVGAVSHYGVKYATGRFSANALRDLRQRTTTHSTMLPLSFTERHHSGDLVARQMNDASVVQGFFEGAFADLVYQPILFLATFVYMFTLNWQLLLVCLATLPVGMVLLNLLSRPLTAFSQQEQEGFARLYALAQDSIGGITMSKAFNLEKPLYERYKVAAEAVLAARLNFEWRSGWLMPVSFFLRGMPSLVLIGYGGSLALAGQLTPGELFAFVYLLQSLTRPLNVLPELIAEVRRTTAAAQRLLSLLDEPTERDDGTAFPSTNNPAFRCSAVHFAYPEQPPILESLSFVVPVGQTVALVGHSGSGKSTLFKLLCGFYPPDAGELALYDKLYTAWSLQALRQQIALVSQETYLFPATIAENIVYGRPDATLAEIMAAAQAANSHGFITQLPAGYQTYVGERGNRLSGGERQRIGIARALLMDAPILLLDEPTSALDSQAEALVQEALARLMVGRTVLVIAHRLSTIQQADMILVLDQGRIVEEGTHAVLMERDGIYRQLYLKQVVA